MNLTKEAPIDTCKRLFKGQLQYSIEWIILFYFSYLGLKALVLHEILIFLFCSYMGWRMGKNLGILIRLHSACKALEKETVSGAQL